MANKRQQTSAPTNTSIYQNRRQRRDAIRRAQVILAQAENVLTAAIFFVVFLLPLLFDPTLIFNLSAWLWWVKGYAWMGLLAWGLIRLLVVLPLAPAQLAGATVDAMEQTAPPDEGPVSFPAEPVEIECTPLSRPPAPAEQKAGWQAYWRQQWRRPGRRLLFGLPVRRQLPLPSHSLEPSA